MRIDEDFSVEMGPSHGWRYRSRATAGLLALMLSVSVSDTGRQALATDARPHKGLGRPAAGKASQQRFTGRAAQTRRWKPGDGRGRGRGARLDRPVTSPPDGSWNLIEYSNRCKDGTCTINPANTQIKTTPAATAMGLLPLLAAGHTHKTDGPYRKAVQNGLQWFLHNQRPDGDLGGGAAAQMYSHGLASLALCDAYAMTADPTIGRAAQQAIDFIEAAQDPATGGWRYVPRQGGDTCVLGWQLMALEVGRLGGLKVQARTIDGAKKWLSSVAQGECKGRFCYVPGSAPSPSMTAVGLLASQHLGMKQNDPAMIEGARFLMDRYAQQANNIYSLYYATQVMHQLPGKQWDASNLTMRELLLKSQEKGQGCAAGSWNPAGNVWATSGGRVMVTSFSCLTLEVYYRYPRLYEARE